MTDIRYDEAVEVHGLVRTFGDLRAVDGVDLSAPRGTVLGLLGPNGAGKTTTIDCLTTLLRPDEGRVRVAGVDVVADPDAVRDRIAVTGQFAALDDELTGRENLVLFGRLRGLHRQTATARSVELLERFGLSDAGDERVSAYSGGMRRRLDLAASLAVEPEVLFLDEPTTGLDPRSRVELWDTVRDLRETGMTTVLTTQYLEEADVLADHIVVIDGGRIIAEGTADQLKERAGPTRCEVTLADPAQVERAVRALVGMGEPTVDHLLGRLVLDAPDGAATLASALAALDRDGIEPADIGLRRPSLDDVFLALTGHRPAAATDGASDPETAP